MNSTLSRLSLNTTNVIPPISLDVYLTDRFPDLHSVIADLDAYHHQLLGGSAYRHFTRFNVIRSVCLQMGLDVNRPAMHVEVQSGLNRIFIMGREDVIKWAGTVGGTFDNKKPIMQAVCSAVTYLEGREDPAQVELLRELQGLAIHPRALLEIPVRERPASITWHCTKLQTVVGMWMRR